MFVGVRRIELMEDVCSMQLRCCVVPLLQMGKCPHQCGRRLRAWDTKTFLRHFGGNILSICNLGWWTEHDHNQPLGLYCATAKSVTVAPAIKHCQSLPSQLPCDSLIFRSKRVPELVQITFKSFKMIQMWWSGQSFVCRYRNMSAVSNRTNPHDTVFFSKLLENGNKSLRMSQALEWKDSWT